jgi:hypothetical protein
MLLALAKSTNLGVRFLLELCALGALGYWGFQTQSGLLLKIVVGIGAPLVAAVVWAIFVSPNASIPVSTPVWLLLQLVIFGAAVAGLAIAGRQTLAWLFALVVLINGALMYVWQQ